ncbi:TorF family putative porin [Undibacterium arcticum]
MRIRVAFSFGTWASNVSNRYIENGTMEWDLYGGYTGTASDFGYSALIYYYKYPGASFTATNTKYDYGELSFGATYKFFCTPNTTIRLPKTFFRHYRRARHRLSGPGRQL